MKIPNYLLLGFFLISNQVLFAQQPTATENNFNLQQCIEYAVNNHASIKSAKYDQQIATARIGEIRASGLPQANINASLIDNTSIQKMFVPASAFGAGPSDQLLALKFGVQYSSVATLGVTQMLFNGSYLVGLEAAKTYSELARKSVDISKNTIIQNVSKAYYLTVINKERQTLFTTNLARLDTLLRQTKASNKAGFVEKIDVDRLEVSYNNILTEKQKFDNLHQMSIILLKFQMGMPQTENLNLIENISSIATSAIQSNNQATYTNRPEYSLMLTQKRMYELDLKNNRVGYLPTLNAFGNVGYNKGALNFSDMYSSQWYSFSNIGMSLNVPVFDGFSKSYKAQQSKLNIDKTNTSLANLENMIDMQLKVAEINLKNSSQSLENQSNNMKLAEEVSRVTKAKYQQGVGSNLEVTNAEAALKEAQINYYNALYDVLVYKVDMDYALGNLK